MNKHLPPRTLLSTKPARVRRHNVYRPCPLLDSSDTLFTSRVCRSTHTPPLLRPPHSSDMREADPIPPKTLCTTQSRQRSSLRRYFTARQRQILNKSYQEDTKPSQKTRENLSRETGLSVLQIRIWFQNKRNREGQTKPRKKGRQREATRLSLDRGCRVTPTESGQGSGRRQTRRLPSSESA